MQAQLKFNILSIKMDEIINRELVMHYQQKSEMRAQEIEEVAEQVEEVPELKKKKKKDKKHKNKKMNEEVEGEGLVNVQTELDKSRAAFKQSMTIVYKRHGDSGENDNTLFRQKEDVDELNKKKKKDGEVESMKKTCPLREEEELADLKKKKKMKNKNEEVESMEKTDALGDEAEVKKKRKMKKKDKKMEGDDKEVLGQEEEIAEVNMEGDDKEVVGQEEEIAGVNMEGDEVRVADLDNTNSEEAGVKTIEQLKGEAREIAQELERMLNNMKCEAKDIPSINITHISQVTTVYLLRKEFNIELNCSFEQGNSSRTPMTNAIKAEASKMGVTLEIFVHVLLNLYLGQLSAIMTRAVQ